VAFWLAENVKRFVSVFLFYMLGLHVMHGLHVQMLTFAAASSTAALAACVQVQPADLELQLSFTLDSLVCC
jgi:hypothetical protein